MPSRKLHPGRRGDPISAYPLAADQRVCGIFQIKPGRREEGSCEQAGEGEEVVKNFAIRAGLMLAAIVVFAMSIAVVETPMGYIFHVKSFSHPRNEFEAGLSWVAVGISIPVAVRFYRLFAMRLCKPKSVTPPTSRQHQG